MPELRSPLKLSLVTPRTQPPASPVVHMLASSLVLQESSSSTDAAMADLEKRIASLEIGKGYDATKEAVQKVEKEFLIKFREIKAALESEAGTKANSKELEALRAENALLKQKNAKLEYRVQHCVESMEKMYKFVEN